MKKCAKCKKEYHLNMFNKHKRSSDGYGSYCISCKSEYAKEYRKKNRSRLNKSAKKWREANPERMAELYKEYDKNNRDKRNAIKAKRKAKKIFATPVWANHEIINSIYAFSSFLTKCTFGKGYHVDHIIPLVSNSVCGLHVEYNLQIIRAEENMKKSNKLLKEYSEYAPHIIGAGRKN